MSHPVRPNMLPEPTCYGCLGTGYLIWGSLTARQIPCLHHGPDCEPGCCVGPCEHKAEDDDDDPEEFDAFELAVFARERTYEDEMERRFDQMKEDRYARA